MVDITEERRPMDLCHLLLIPDDLTPVELLYDAAMSQRQLATPELRRQANNQSTEHLLASWRVFVRREMPARCVDVQ